MVVVVIVLAALATLLLVATLRTRRLLGAQRALTAIAEETAARRETEVVSATEARDAAEQARADAEVRAKMAEARRAEIEDQARMADGRASAADQRAADAEAETERARHEAAEASAARVDAQTRLAALEQRAAEAEAEAAAAATAAPAVTGELDAQVVWALERSRTERTWRQSVAVGPDGSAFTESSDPLYEALQIELDAAREDVGAVVELDADLPADVTAAGAVLTLRAAQELLAQVVRRSESTTLHVRADGRDLVIDVESLDEDGNRIEPGRLPTPPSTAIEPTPTGVRIRNAVATPTPD